MGFPDGTHPIPRWHPNSLHGAFSQSRRGATWKCLPTNITHHWAAWTLPLPRGGSSGPCRDRQVTGDPCSEIHGTYQTKERLPAPGLKEHIPTLSLLLRPQLDRNYAHSAQHREQRFSHQNVIGKKKVYMHIFSNKKKKKATAVITNNPLHIFKYSNNL